jgi:hypothetical protein
MRSPDRPALEPGRPERRSDRKECKNNNEAEHIGQQRRAIEVWQGQ